MKSKIQQCHIETLIDSLTLFTSWTTYLLPGERILGVDYDQEVDSVVISVLRMGNKVERRNNPYPMQRVTVSCVSTGETFTTMDTFLRTIHDRDRVFHFIIRA